MTFTSSLRERLIRCPSSAFIVSGEAGNGVGDSLFNSKYTFCSHES